MALSRRIEWGVALVAATVIVGSVAFMLVEDMSLLDALYTTFITISTVGFAEPVGGFSSAGKLVVIALIIAGVGAVFYTATAGLELALEGFLGGRRVERIRRKRIEAMNDQVIVCGYGRVGRHIISTLEAAGSPFVVIEIDRERATLAVEERYSVVHGDASHDEALIEAGIASAGSLVAAVKSDSDNLAIVLSARALRPDLRIVARASEPQAQRKHLLAGADRVVSPSVVGGERLAAMALDPDLAEFVDLSVHGDLVEMRIEEYSLKASSALAGTRLADSGIHEKTGALVLAVRAADGAIALNPGATYTLQAGQIIMAIGLPAQLEDLKSLAG